MAKYTDVAQMLRDIRSYITFTGRKVKLGDDPKARELGYVDDYEGPFAMTWTISLPDLKKSIPEGKAGEAISQGFKSEAGRLALVGL